MIFLTEKRIRTQSPSIPMVRLRVLWQETAENSPLTPLTQAENAHLHRIEEAVSAWAEDGMPGIGPLTRRGIPLLVLSAEQDGQDQRHIILSVRVTLYGILLAAYTVRETWDENGEFLCAAEKTKD